MANAATEIVAMLGKQQYGVVAREQLLEAGLERGLIDGRISRGELRPLENLPGVYAVGHEALTRQSHMIAATLAYRAHLSHSAAAELWGLRGRAREIELVRTTKGLAVPGFIVHRSSTLAEADLDERQGIPVTSVPRTLADISTRLHPKQLERAVIAAERQELLDWSAMEELLNRRHYRARALRAIIGRADPRAVELAEGLEEIFMQVWNAKPRPEPVFQALVEGYRVDFLWALARVIVECDGYRYHSGRLMHDSDRIRDMRLRAAGYEIHRATHRILTEMPEQFVETVHRSIIERSRRFGVVFSAHS